MASSARCVISVHPERSGPKSPYPTRRATPTAYSSATASTHDFQYHCPRDVKEIPRRDSPPCSADFQSSCLELSTWITAGAFLLWSEMGSWQFRYGENFSDFFHCRSVSRIRTLLLVPARPPTAPKQARTYAGLFKFHLRTNRRRQPARDMTLRRQPYSRSPAGAIRTICKIFLDQNGLRYRVDDQGVSGDTTTDRLARIDNVIAEHPRSGICSNFGGTMDFAAFRNRYGEKHNEMISRLQQASIPPVSSSASLSHLTTVRTT